jgi:hypothetical protein
MIVAFEFIWDHTSKLCYHHHHNDQGLGLKTCSFKAQGGLGLPIPAVPEVGKPASVGGFCPFVPGDLTISFDTLLCYVMLMLCFTCRKVLRHWIDGWGPAVPCRKILWNIDSCSTKAMIVCKIRWHICQVPYALIPGVSDIYCQKTQIRSGFAQTLFEPPSF